MEEKNESKKPYVEPTIVKCERLTEITEGVAQVSAVAPVGTN